MNDSHENRQSNVGPAASTPVIPDMQLLRRIGKGAFGEVWLAQNRTTGGLRAVKLVPLRGTASVDPAGREIVSLNRLEKTFRLRDPNLVTIHHVGTTADHLFYIMDPADDISGTPASCGAEYDPATLAVRLRAGPVDDHDCLNWSTQLLSALACLHQVVFQYPGLDDLEVGRIDFSKTHEIVAHWPDRNASRMKVKR